MILSHMFLTCVASAVVDKNLGVGSQTLTTILGTIRTCQATIEKLNRSGLSTKGHSRLVLSAMRHYMQR
jgi:hypothetical protein